MTNLKKKLTKIIASTMAVMTIASVGAISASANAVDLSKPDLTGKLVYHYDSAYLLEHAYSNIHQYEWDMRTTSKKTTNGVESETNYALTYVRNNIGTYKSYVEYGVQRLDTNGTPAGIYTHGGTLLPKTSSTHRGIVQKTGATYFYKHFCRVYGRSDAPEMIISGLNKLVRINK